MDFAPSVGFSNLDFYFTARSAEEGLITDESLIILLSRECSSLTPLHASACLMDGLRFRSRERTHVPTQRKTRAVTLPTEKKRIADPTKRCNHHRRIVA